MASTFEGFQETGTFVILLVAYEPSGEPYTVRYNMLTPMLLNEVQKLHRQAEQDQAQISELNAQRANDEREIAQLESQIDDLQKEQQAAMRQMLSELQSLKATLATNHLGSEGEHVATAPLRQPDYNADSSSGK